MIRVGYGFVYSCLTNVYNVLLYGFAPHNTFDILNAPHRHKPQHFKQFIYVFVFYFM
jgi:hypothetical protein